MGGFKIYYSFLLGAFGGALGWYLIASFLGQSNEFVRGAVLGGCIGLFATSYDALITGAPSRIAKLSGIGAALGVVAGTLGLPIGEMIYKALAGSSEARTVVSVLGGAIGYAALGTIIGAAEGVGKGTQLWKALVGGLVGGLAGGIFFEVFGRASTRGGAAQGASEQQFVAIALTLLGGSIGAAVAWFTTALKDAWFEIQSGKLAGTVINLSKYVAGQSGARNVGVMGGSTWEANIYLPGDPDIRPRHAELTLRDGAPTLTIDEGAQREGAKLQVNGRDATRWPLADGDTLRVGGTDMVYRDKRQ